MKNFRLFVLAIVLVILAGLFSEPADITAGAGMVKFQKITVNSTGSEGSAGGSDTSDVIQGRVVRVDIDYAAGITTTTDLTVYGTNDLITTNVVNRANTATDAQLFPTVQLTDNTGTGRTYDGTRPVVDYYPVSDQLTVSITQTTAATPAVTVEIFYVED